MPDYLKDPDLNLFVRADFSGIAYSDGEETEQRMLEIMRSVQDLSVFSQQLARHITDWPTEYHFSRQRHCLIRPLGIRPGETVLEVGCGCGAITRFLGETGALVTAVEGGLTRARIAAERCRDLPNVRVIAEDLIKLDLNETFDWILLVGVLEYAPVFSAAPEPARHYLEYLSQFLEPQGRLVIAIENKLGLKYFNACGEDHLGTPFFGIQGLYGTGQPRTYGRKELADLLTRSGFADAEFLYPFPDYKLPRIVLTQAGIDDPGFASEELLAALHARDYLGNDFRLFDESLVLRTLAHNDLLAEMSHSFLVLATRPTHERQADRLGDLLAVSYATNRAAAFAAETRFLRANDRIELFKAPLFPDIPHEVMLHKRRTLRQVVGTGEYVNGTMAIWPLLEARARQGGFDDIVGALRPWFGFLFAKAQGCGTSLTDYTIDGNKIDLTPFNLITTSVGLQAIDQEWVIDGPVPLGWVALRGIFFSRAEIPGYERIPLGIRQVLRGLCADKGLKVSDEDIRGWLHLESLFQTAVWGDERRMPPETIGSKQIVPLVRLASEQGAALTGVSAENGALQQAVTEKDVHIGNLGAMLARNAEVSAELAAEKDNLQKAIIEKDIQIVNINSKLNDLSQNIRNSLRSLDSRDQEIRNLHTRLDEARQMIRNISESVSWRITAPLRIIKRLFKYLVAMFFSEIRRSPLTVIPIMNLHLHHEHPPTWEAVSDDPKFAIEGPIARFAGAWVMLRVNIKSEDQRALYPRLYIDDSMGFREETAITLPCSADRGIRHIFRLPDTAKTLRLDPCERPCRFMLGDVSVRRISKVELMLRLLWRAFGSQRAAGKSWSSIAATAMRIMRHGSLELLKSKLIQKTLNTETIVNYFEWLKCYEMAVFPDPDVVKSIISEMKDAPLISIVMPVYNTPEKLLIATIKSVQAQIYEKWELCIADDGSTKEHVKRILQRFAQQDSRIKIVYRQKNGHISEASNSALELASGAWTALLDHDDLLHPHALSEVAFEIARRPDAELIYSDEDKVDQSENRYDPHFKPNFSRELFRSQNYLNHLTVHRTRNIREAGGWRTGFEGSQDYDLSLRILERIQQCSIYHIPKILYHWRAIEGSTALSSSEKNYAYGAGMRALTEHVQRTGLDAKVEEVPGSSYYRLRLNISASQPLVSLIIPTRNKASLLRGCIASIQQKTTYQAYEIIVVDNGSDELEALDYLEQLKSDDRIRVLRYDQPFNFSAINNFAVAQAKGTIIGMINNDIEVISPDWLTEMVSWAMQSDVGCVGAKLYYGDGRIQHAGVILGVGGVAGHSHKYFPHDHPGYFSRLKLTQNLSAVTAACLLVKKSIYEAVGGLDETNLRVAFNDVDFCLKVRAAGYVNVWTPYAELYHLESVSRGAEDNPEKIQRFNAEVEYMKRRWKLIPDPYYSVMLTLDREDFSPTDDPSLLPALNLLNTGTEWS